MKIVIVEKFEDLKEANAYIKKINEAFKALEAAAEGSKKAMEELQALLAKTTSEHNEKVLELQEKIETLSAQIENSDPSQLELLQSELNEANELIADLGAQLAAQASISVSDKRIVSIKGAQYYLKGEHFIVPKFGSLTAEELAANDDALEFMLDRKSDSLEAINASN